MKPGDFTGLAQAYTKYRPNYSDMIVSCIIGSLRVPFSSARVADVGAGTGIFTRQLLEKLPRSIFAIEPNQDMFEVGKSELGEAVKWIQAGAEATGLEDNSIDLVTMASSFHWPNTQQALAEFNRVLAVGGVFAAVWNPRLTERSESESEIDRLLETNFGVRTRVSSGRSDFANGLEKTLRDSGHFCSTGYLESVEVKKVGVEDYIGAWTSVNDIQSQLGPIKFQQFIEDITRLLAGHEFIDVHYLTRCWMAQKS